MEHQRAHAEEDLRVPVAINPQDGALGGTAAADGTSDVTHDGIDSEDLARPATPQPNHGGVQVLLNPPEWTLRVPQTLRWTRIVPTTVRSEVLGVMITIECDDATALLIQQETPPIV